MMIHDNIVAIGEETATWSLDLLEIITKFPSSHIIWPQKGKNTLNNVILDTVYLKEKLGGHGWNSVVCKSILLVLTWSENNNWNIWKDHENIYFISKATA